MIYLYDEKDAKMYQLAEIETDCEDGVGYKVMTYMGPSHAPLSDVWTKEDQLKGYITRAVAFSKGDEFEFHHCIVSKNKEGIVAYYTDMLENFSVESLKIQAHIRSLVQTMI